MVAKMAAGTYNLVTNSARMLILMSRDRFSGSSYSMLPLASLKNKSIDEKSKMAALYLDN